MAEQTFRYGPCELLVVAEAEGDTVGFITQGHDREDLDHDETRRLIAFLQDIVGEGLSRDQLNAMDPDDRVVDRDGGIWTRDSEGDWGCPAYWRSVTATEVVKHWGPVRKVG